jgi:C-terminal processing protease CtpA/Prc
MTRNSIILVTFFISFYVLGQEQYKLENLKTFAKAFGYIKYFHPSDEASKIDWNGFAAYGSQKVLECETTQETIKTLNLLFKPIAPSVSFSYTKQLFSTNSITPKNPKDYIQTYWQHKGLSFQTPSLYDYDLYKSVRVNRMYEVDESSDYGMFIASINAEAFRGKNLKYTAQVKVEKNLEGAAHLWFRVDDSNKESKFFDNIKVDDERTFTWKSYDIIAKVDSIAADIVFGGYLAGKGQMFIDDVQLFYQDKEEWIEIPLENGGFEIARRKNKAPFWNFMGQGYDFMGTEVDNSQGQQGLSISYKGQFKKQMGKPIFTERPKFGEVIEEEIGGGIFCQIPLVLYANEMGTYPKAQAFKELQFVVNKIPNDSRELAVRLGNVITTFNVFQHFYPYFDVVEVDWEDELMEALKSSYNDKNQVEHVFTLEKFTAPLNDGHIAIRGGQNLSYTLPIKWEWIENKLIITRILDKNIDAKVGDVVDKINGLDSQTYFQQYYDRISAATKGWLRFRAQQKSIFGKKDEPLDLIVNGKPLQLSYHIKFDYDFDRGIAIQEYDYKLLEDDIYYINLSKLEMDTITKLLPKLSKAKGIICDVRSRPGRNKEFIGHLLKEDDTSKTWLNIPYFIYPNRKKIAGFHHTLWNIKAKSPHLDNEKIVFLTDESAISYAESYLSYVKHYRLGTIIGQPTAGTNGNMNIFDLLDNIRIWYTGMQVLKHNGSQHHGIGVLPDIYVHRTIKGIREGRDEFLDKALQILTK